MEKEEKNKGEEKTSDNSIASKVNLDDYAGDAEDHQKAEDQSNKYRDDLKAPQEPTPPGRNQEG